MSNRLSSNSWLKASDEVVEGLPGVFKLVDYNLIGGRDYNQFAERATALLDRCQQAGMTLASNKVHVGSKVSFASKHTVRQPKEGRSHHTIPRTNWYEGAARLVRGLQSAQPVHPGPGRGAGDTQN